MSFLACFYFNPFVLYWSSLIMFQECKNAKSLDFDYQGTIDLHTAIFGLVGQSVLTTKGTSDLHTAILGLVGQSVSS